MSLDPSEKLARLERALSWGGPTHTVADVVQRVRDGRASWWESDNGDGIIVTEAEQFPLVKVLRYWLIAGDLKECLALEDRINREAVANGCEVAVAAGRKGWLRAAAPIGWRLHSYNYVKPLTLDFWRR